MLQVLFNFSLLYLVFLLSLTDWLKNPTRVLQWLRNFPAAFFDTFERLHCWSEGKINRYKYVPSYSKRAQRVGLPRVLLEKKSRKDLAPKFLLSKFFPQVRLHPKETMKATRNKETENNCGVSENTEEIPYVQSVWRKECFFNDEHVDTFILIASFGMATYYTFAYNVEKKHPLLLLLWRKCKVTLCIPSYLPYVSCATLWRDKCPWPFRCDLMNMK